MTKLAACLIVRNSEGTLGACLDSIRPFVDGVFLYDTGSTDGTLELVERLNEKTHLLLHPETGDVAGWADSSGEHIGAEFPLDDAMKIEWRPVPLAPITVQKGEWRNDFSWARQRSWEMPPSEYDWLVWLDDDDEIQNAGFLRYFAATAPPEVDGAIFQYDYARDESGNTVCVLWRERLIRRSAGYEWRGAVHEVLVPPEGKLPALAHIPPEQCRWIHHRPPDRYSPDRNLEILLAEKEKCEAEGKPVPPRTLAYLGTEHMSKGRFAEAIPYLQAYIEHPESLWSDERAQVHHKLAQALRAVGNPQASIHVEFEATKERDNWAENAVGLAQSFAILGQWGRAELWAKRALDLKMPQSPLILNPLEFSLVPLLILADAALAQGNYDGALAAVNQAAALVPGMEAVQARRQEITRDAYHAEVAGAVLCLREALVRHDENLKAWNLLSEAVPYWLQERPEIVKARADQREMVAHALRPQEYQRWYVEEPKESTVEDEYVPEIGEYIPRAKRLLEGLQEQEKELGRKPRTIDLGANDMWIACYLWKQGRLIVDGVELNKQSFVKGKKRMRTFGAPGKYVQGDLHDAAELLRLTVNGAKGDRQRYDAVVIFEVIEHVPDLERTLKVCESLLAPGGIVYLSTPNGAYEQGQLDGWHKVERKGHLRAIPGTELATLLQSRGSVEMLEAQHDGRVTFAAYRPKRRKGSVVFYAGPGWEPWSPASIRSGGLGGSETALVQVASRLAQRGWLVSVYSGAEPGLAGGAIFRPFTAWDPSEECDLLVVSRLPHAFDVENAAKATALWCHDHSYPGALTEARAEKIDHIVTLSDWQRNRFQTLYPFALDKLGVIRNGITVTEADGTPRYPDADRPFTERKPRVVYSSSADRGLDVMLTVWPQIRLLVPDAELHVFYGWNVFDRVAMVNPALQEYKQKILMLVDRAFGEEGGVFMRGRVGQVELADAMQEARVWGFPTAFLETSCIGAMEARAAGLPIVTSALAALKETAKTGKLIPWRGPEDQPVNQDDSYQRVFVRMVARLLSDEEAWQTFHKRALQGVASLDWSKRIPQWESLVPTRRRAKKREAVAA